MNQSLIDEIVANVLAQLQPAVPRTSIAPPEFAPNNKVAAAPTVDIPPSFHFPAAQSVAVVAAPAAKIESKPEVSSSAVSLDAPVITADLLASTVQPGQTLKVGRRSILTPSAKDWLHSHRMSWSRQDKSAGRSNGNRSAAWRVIFQSMTPTVKTLHDSLRQRSEWNCELVGLPAEAAARAISLIAAAESDGVVIFTEHAEVVACRTNRNDRARAAAIQSSKQWQFVSAAMKPNVVCISPTGRTFVELRNLLHECAESTPQVPDAW